MPAPRPGEYLGYDLPGGQAPVSNDALFKLWNDSPEFRECNYQQYRSTGMPTALMVAVHTMFNRAMSHKLNKLERQNKIALQRAMEINQAAKKKGMNLCENSRLILPA